MVESTLAMIKPDAVDRADQIEQDILNAGFTILQVGPIWGHKTKL